MFRLPAISSFRRLARRHHPAIVRAAARRSVTIEPMEPRQLLTATPKLVPVAISSAAIAADSKLANYKTFDLQVTIAGTDDWASGDLKLTLSGGTFYVPTGNSNVPQKSLFASKPNLQFDTFVSSPNFNSPF